MTIDRAAFPFAATLIVLTVVVGLLAPPLTTAIPLALLAFVLWFFRDPERVVPDVAGALVCPADGKILRTPPGRISIFMNVFDVHVCRTPVAGTVSEIRHFPGRFVSAYREDAPDCNERLRIRVETPTGPLEFTLVAGLVARRIVCRVTEGQRLEAGERVGLIRFGSRVDVELPAGAEAKVAPGERVSSGSTVLGIWPAAAGGSG